ncbi:hypothetical protein CMV_027458 [Castanea mollissima]|uniref:Uncharacterized protein n=1 Tax=Castanea mollissima TaxID=60419 RepID=A0A8J4VF04_9ROSI|nr:hypothetical protein CMV_027458 [Castanea mollissima]
MPMTMPMPMPMTIIVIIVTTTMIINPTIMIMTMIILMGIQQQSHGWALMGRCTIAMMDWHHTHMNPYTPEATSAEELHHFSPGISIKELSLLALVALLVLGIFYFPF